MAGELWSAGIARKSLVRTRTHNPSPAASRLLGALRVARGKRRLKKLGFKRRHKGNPLPAAVATVTGLLGGKLGARLKGPEAKHQERMARLAQLAERALQNDASALAEIQELTRSFATQRAKDAAKATLAAVANELAERGEVKARERAAERRAAQREAGAASAAREQRFLGAATTIGSALLQGGRRQGGAGLRGVGARAVRGATSRVARAGVARGAAGLATAGAGATAAVVIGGLAAGAIIGTLLRKSFGEARAIRAEETAVEGALALRRGRAELESQLGRRLTAAEARRLFTAYEQELVGLGFQQDATGRWHRPRSAIERLLG